MTKLMLLLTTEDSSAEEQQRAAEEWHKLAITTILIPGHSAPANIVDRLTALNIAVIQSSVKEFLKRPLAIVS